MPIKRQCDTGLWTMPSSSFRNQRGASNIALIIIIALGILLVYTIIVYVSAVVDINKYEGQILEIWWNYRSAVKENPDSEITERMLEKMETAAADYDIILDRKILEKEGILEKDQDPIEFYPDEMAIYLKGLRIIDFRVYKYKKKIDSRIALTQEGGESDR